MDLIGSALAGVRVAEPIVFGHLTMWPLVGEDEREAWYFTLDEALDQGWVEVTEVSEQGSVPELTVVNEAPRPVLLVDGEELVGAKQNRVVNLTILVPAARTTRIPVSCVEAGRWTRRSDACWSSSRRLGRSATGAMSMMYETHHESLEEYVRTFAPVGRQRGAVFAVTGGVMGLDLFDRAWTFMSLRAKLVRSFAIGAIDTGSEEGLPRDPKGHAPAAPEAVRPFLQAVAAAQAEEFDAVGEGTDARLTGRSVSGAALIAARRVVHVSAFGTTADFR